MNFSRGTVIKNDDNHVYYNVLISHDPSNNPNGSPTPAVFKETRSDPIIDNPSDYHLSVIRFSIPAQEIPIFIVDIEDTVTNETPYSITLEFGATVVQQKIIYTSLTDYTPSTNVELPFKYRSNPYYWVTSYQNFIDNINTAFSTAFATLVGLPPGVTEAPYFIFDPVTQLVNLIVQKTYVGVINVYCNNFLYAFFRDSFLTHFHGNNAPNGTQNEFIIEDTKNNSFDSTHFIMRQEYSTLFNWNTFTSLVLLTGSIPIKSEYIRGSSTQHISFNNVSDNFRQILTDFEPLNEVGTDIRSTIQYFPTGEYRLTDMKGRTPLTFFDVQVYWQDNLQNIYPLMIASGESVTIKFLFRKKGISK